MTISKVLWPDRMNPTDSLFWLMDKIPEMRSTIGALAVPVEDTRIDSTLSNLWKTLHSFFELLRLTTGSDTLTFNF